MKTNTLKGKVEYILANQPKTRNSDETLYIRLLLQFYRDELRSTDNGWALPLQNLWKVPKYDAVTRCRRKFQEGAGKEKYYPPTKSTVLKKRKKNAEEVRSTINNANWDEKLPQ